MKRFILCFVFCILCSVSQAANDFSGDANCKALWRFENGALTTDSKGTNTLTAQATPVADTVTYKEGAASCDFEFSEDDYFGITDAALDAGYPLKNGDANKKISVAGWVRLEALPASSGWRFIYCKGNGVNTNSLALSIYNDGAKSALRLSIGYNAGVNWEHIDFGTGIAANQWYHIGVTFQDSDKSYKIRIWDDTASALLGGAEQTGNSTNNINVETAQVSVGFFDITSGYGWDGLLDEMAVFNDILTSDEIDQIRAGTYGAAPPAAGGQVIIINME